MPRLARRARIVAMPRTCVACSHPERAAIDNALAAGQPFRDIAGRFSLSRSGLHRHKDHVAQAIVKAGERREERLGDNLLDEMRRVQRKAWELLAKTESEGDHRGAIVALREVRECLETLGAMLARQVSVGHSGVVEHVLTERERREAEESIKCLMACDRDAEHPLVGEFAEEGQS